MGEFDDGVEYSRSGKTLSSGALVSSAFRDGVEWNEAHERARISAMSSVTAQETRVVIEPIGNGAGILTLIESGIVTWWAFTTNGNTIKAASNVIATTEYRIAVEAFIGLVIFFGYGLASVWLVRKVKFVALAFFGVLWAYAGFKLAGYFGGNGSWQLGSGVVLGLFAIFEKDYLSRE